MFTSPAGLFYQINDLVSLYKSPAPLYELATALNQIESYLRPCLAHAGHIGTDRSLLMGHNALLLRQIARDLLHASLHRHNDTWTAFF